MKISKTIFILAIFTLQNISFAAEPVEAKIKVEEMSDDDFSVASLLHGIYEYSVLEKKVKKQIMDRGGERTASDNIPSINLKNFVQRLGTLVNIKSLKVKIARDLERVKKAGLGPGHPDRRWLEHLLHAIEKYAKPTK